MGTMHRNRSGALVPIASVEERYFDGEQHTLYRCDCGCLTWLPSITPDALSCGCGRPHPDSFADPRIKLRSTLSGMRRRCHVESDAGWARYGGRGIRVCERWRNSFSAFCDDMLDSMIAHVRLHGALHTTIDRIDNDGNYEPGNCRWATPHEQHLNSRARDGSGRTVGEVEAEAMSRHSRARRLRRKRELAMALKSTGSSIIAWPDYAGDFLDSDAGLQSVEYAIVAGLIVAGLVVIVVAIGGWVRRHFTGLQRAVGAGP